MKQYEHAVRKEKIAISVDKSLLDLVDSKVDGNIIRSRSQAMEYYLRKGLSEESVTKAVILLRGEHQQYSLKLIKGKKLIEHQLEGLKEGGIKKVYIITGTAKDNSFLETIADMKKLGMEIQIISDKGKGNVNALLACKENLLDSSFVVLNGDTYVELDLKGMIKKHLSMDKLSTMGLMTREKPSDYGTAVLDGDLIVDFEHHPKNVRSYTVNAGVYIFKPESFELMDSKSLEKDVFPKLARIKQLAGFFTYGEYVHMEE